MNPILTRTRAALWLAVNTETDLSPDASRLWSAILDEAVGSTRLGQGTRVLTRLGWDPRATVDRMLRSRVPGARRCVDWCSLCYAAALFDGPDDRINSVGITLGHAGSGSFNRSVRRLTGQTATYFRDTASFPVAREMMLDQVVRPYRAQWATFSHVVRHRHAHPSRSLVAA